MSKIKNGSMQTSFVLLTDAKKVCIKVTIYELLMIKSISDPSIPDVQMTDKTFPQFEK